MNRHIVTFLFLFGIILNGQSQVVINELMIDPSPVVALPDCEFIELYNRGTDSVNLSNWIIKGGSCDCVLPSFSVASRSYVVIASTSSKGKFDSFGNVLYCPCFPTLNNDGKTLWLINSNGQLQDFVNYDISWYGSSKSQGGWSLERKDASLACSCAANWSASTDISGGTPDKENSIIEQVSISKPIISSIGTVTDSSVTITFSSQMDSVSIYTKSNYFFDHGFGNPVAVYSNFPKYDEVTVVVSSVIQSKEIYRVTVLPSIINCGKMPIDAIQKRFAIADTVSTNDVIINEILFNPPSDGVDFVELYNRSSKILDLKDISIANKNTSTNQIGTISSLSSQGLLLFPDEYVVVTSDSAILKQKYKIPDDAIIISLSSFPSYPDDKGIVSVTNRQGITIDEFYYNASMQNEQLATVEGVSLERIQPDIATNQITNWHSAAWSNGFATPGYRNSQYLDSQSGEKLLTISPKVISPDNDGVDDVASFSFNLPDEGYSATISLFNQNGMLVRTLISNKSVATSGTIYWDGTDNNASIVPIGIYIIYCSASNSKGDKKQYKTTCTVVSK